MYNGHKNWTHWNVSLWLNNDEGLYDLCRRAVRRAKNLDKAARMIFEEFQAMDITETSDGAKYSVSSIRAALVGM